MKKILFIFGLSFMSTGNFAMNAILTPEQIIDQCNQDISCAQEHIREIDLILCHLKPVSSDCHRQKEMWAAVSLLTDNWNEKEKEFKDLKRKEIASHQMYICYLTNTRLFYLTEIQKKQSIVHWLKQSTPAQPAKQ